MKKIASLFLVALFAGATTIGLYKIWFEKESTSVAVWQNSTPFLKTNNIPVATPGGKNLDFTLAAEKTVNSVVHIKNISNVSYGRSVFDFFYGRNNRSNSNPGKEMPQGIGSGVIISPDGYIVTNNHVIADASKLEVTLNNNKSYIAELIGTDKNSDIALLKIDAKESLPSLTFGDSDFTKIGEWVLAVGNPFNLNSTVTAGIISAKARDLDVAGNNLQSFIQTDAAVNPGNSGGALVNVNGDLIGINTAITSRTGSYVGYSFAIPSNIAKKIVDDIIEYGKVQEVLLGISGGDLNSKSSEEFNVEETEGIYITEVTEKSGAAMAGISSGDIIKKIDHIEINKWSDLIGYLKSKRPKDKVALKILRNGKEKHIDVVLTKKNIMSLPYLGIEVKNLDKKDQKKFKTTEGIKIIKSRQYDGMEGKVLLEINDEKIEDVQHARQLEKNMKKYLRSSITLINEQGERERIIFQ